MLKLKKIQMKNIISYSSIIRTIKQKVKEAQTSRIPIIKFGISILYRMINSAKIIKRLCFDKDYRYNSLLQLFNSKNIHQTTTLTFLNRYPVIFSACRKFFNGRQDLKILSYGCSTGEEVLTLRQYFPVAYIVGADINRRSLAKCGQLPVDDKITFVYSKISELQKVGPFDAVFCMAVFQRTPHAIEAKGIKSLKNIYPFEKFERQVIELDKLIKPQGLLVIHYTQYSFLDTVVSSKYKILGEYNQDDYQLPVFDKNSDIIINPKAQSSIYIKLHE